ncbi:MAG: DegV family protein [Anaeroplasmataceae bacterium]
MLRLFTDSDTDMTPEVAKRYGYNIISMPYIINDKVIYPYKDYEEFNAKEFYDLLRKGVIPTTSALNIEEYINYFEPVFQAGDDILYVRFSAAMSATFQNMNKALDILKEKYPERKFYEIDTLGITIMSYIIVREVGELVNAGKSIEEILEWSKNEVLKFATYFYADDLKFFKRSGRVSGLAAFFGGMIGIKPIIAMDDTGTMKTVGKERGRKKAVERLLKYVVELGDDLNNHTIYIAHSDNLGLAMELSEAIKKELGEVNIEFVVVNPTCGAHCGPDCIGVAFHAIHR